MRRNGTVLLESSRTLVSDIDDLYKMYLLGQQQLSKIEINESSYKPQLFVENILDASNEIGFNITAENFLNFFTNLDFEDFLMSFSIRTSTYPILIMKQIDEIRQHIFNSRIWYGFLIDLQNLLSGFDAQNDVKQHKLIISAMINQCSIETNEVKMVNDIGLDQFLNRIANTCTVQNMQVNSYNLAALKSVLHQTLNDNITPTCLSNKITVHGRYVKISNVIQVECWQLVKEIEIFALNKVFIDADIDKTGREVKLSIIAPIWDIIGYRKIILNLEDGKYQPILYANEGKHGKPGLVGDSAGHIFGIGNKFNNDINLQVFDNGGKGGTGQHGRRGLL